MIKMRGLLLRLKQLSFAFDLHQNGNFMSLRVLNFCGLHPNPGLVMEEESSL